MNKASEVSQRAFAAWTPQEVIWSQWAKPIAFLQAEAAEREAAPNLLLESVAIDPATAAVVNLPGAEAVAVGLELSERGFWPVPLFDGTSGPAAVVDVQAIARALSAGAEFLRRRPISGGALPAFLLDSNRMGSGSPPAPGAFDNRWVTLPQDYPSGALLASRGIRTVLLVQRGTLAVAPDLAHVLYRWREHGIRINAIDLADNRLLEDLPVFRPSGFRRMWYTAIALLGLRRSNVGGFGAQVPEDAGSGFG